MAYNKQVEMTKCPNCAGTGKVNNAIYLETTIFDNCHYCQATGKLERYEANRLADKLTGNHSPSVDLNKLLH
ncbi:hypothetical protein [Bacillus piscicola]|uniref:hypothetical protein n=1 Tax=Bacillus piscicola TaxID=1632684 RepID=UPI001F09578F|nr:hypothetical protein [Bacillus piscicola]